MRFLRLGSTRGVVGLLVGAALAAVVLAVVASAALGGGGQAPPPKPLAQAIHDSLGGPRLTGVSARVSLTNSLFAGATSETSSALMKGGNGRLWLAPGKLRVELQSDNGDAQIVYSNGKGFVYDGPSDTAYTFAVNPRQRRGDHGKRDTGMPTIAQIQKRIDRAHRQVGISAARPEVAAGQPAYDVRITPHDRGGLLGAAEVAWDAARGIPLDVALYARGQSKPAIELAVTDITFGAVDPSVFDVTPPAGAKTVDLGGGSAGHAHGQSKKPSFSAVDPATLGPRARRSVKPAGDGFVVLYGKGLDTIAVFEHPAKKNEKATRFGTPLGGIVSFQRAGIAFTVAGSQPLQVLEDAARSL